jgi:hypothetical protein
LESRDFVEVIGVLEELGELDSDGFGVGHGRRVRFELMCTMWVYVRLGRAFMQSSGSQCLVLRPRISITRKEI